MYEQLTLENRRNQVRGVCLTFALLRYYTVDDRVSPDLKFHRFFSFSGTFYGKCAVKWVPNSTTQILLPTFCQRVGNSTSGWDANNSYNMLATISPSTDKMLPRHNILTVPQPYDVVQQRPIGTTVLTTWLLTSWSFEYIQQINASLTTSWITYFLPTTYLNFVDRDVLLRRTIL